MDQPQSQEHFETHEEQEYVLHSCSFHPEVETALGCGKCGKYICPRCMIQTPVGARCPDCVNVTKIPTFDVQPSYYLRAGLTGGVVAVMAGILWNLLSIYIPVLAWVLALGVGYVVGESISVAVNRKRGTGLAVTAGFSMGLAVIASGLLVAVMTNLICLLFVGIAFYIAINRVR